MLPVQITFRDFPESESPILENLIRRKVEKLNQFYKRINSCRVVITVPQKHKHQGKLYAIHIDLTVPGKEIVVNRQADQDLYVAIRDSFQALVRQLENYARKQRGNIKKHEAETYGTIARIFYDEGYGFIQSSDGSELYFSVTNVTNPSFNQLKPGDAVFFLKVPADDGWQAHRITLKHNNLVENH